MARLDDIMAEAAPLTARFVDAGHRLFLVGGIVRDLALGDDLSADTDLDFTTDATPDQIKAVVGPLADALWLQGERFGTVGARVAGRAYEITTHRSEMYLTDSRKPEVMFSTAIHEDLSRRDFTVNAMAVELPSGERIDPFGGAADLAAKRLRTPLDAEISFTDDPLRMLRAARFVAAYGLEPTTDLRDAMHALRTRLDIVSAERVRDELDKLLGVPDPRPGLELLASTGLLGRFLPEVGTEVLPERLAVVDAVDASPELRLTALLHGSDPDQVERRLRALRYSNDRRTATRRTLVALKALTNGEVVDAPALRRWVASAGEHRHGARSIASAVSRQGAEAAATSHSLERELADELDDLGPALTGDEVMDLLGEGQGPDVGRAIMFLQDLRFDEGPLAAAEARARLLTWWRDNVDAVD